MDSPPNHHEFPFPDIYDWISHLPPPCLWSRPSLQLPLFPKVGSVLLIAERTEDGCVSFFFQEPIKGKVCLKRDIKWSNEEDSNDNNMQVVTFPLLSSAIVTISYAIQDPCIFYAIQHPYNFFEGGIYPTEVTGDSFNDLSSITQSSNYPLLFNSAFACVGILVAPLIITSSEARNFISQGILHPELASGIGVLSDPEPLIRLIGTLFTFFCKMDELEPLSWSYARNTCDPCEIKIYCPLLSMITTHNHLCEFPKTSSEKLSVALRYQQLECIVQLRYDLTFKEKFIHLQLGIHNLRCDVRPYEIPFPDAPKDLISTEKYFPSKISITIAPQHPSTDLSISVNRSSANPTYQIGAENSWEASYQAPKDFGVKTSASTSSTKSISSWGFEETAEGVNGTCQWTLYDSSNESGTEVVSSKPSKVPFYRSKTTAWYRDRYRKAASPLTKQGGVVFAGDDYGKGFTWTLRKSMEGQTFKCKIEGTVWLTYWPNLDNTSFYESRYHNFCEIIELPVSRRHIFPRKWVP